MASGDSSSINPFGSTVADFGATGQPCNTLMKTRTRLINLDEDEALKHKATEKLLYDSAENIPAKH